MLEAAGSIGDDRVKVLSESEARVSSSTGEREYRVVVVGEGEGKYRAFSDDNGTIYRGYVGYPIIAFLMARGALPVNDAVARAMAGVPWKELNERYKSYSVVESLVVQRAEKMGVPREVVYGYVNEVMRKLSSMRILFDESLSR